MHESQVSRNERNDYFGITLDRAAKVLDALGVQRKRLVSPALAVAKPDVAKL